MPPPEDSLGNKTHTIELLGLITHVHAWLQQNQDLSQTLPRELSSVILGEELTGWFLHESCSSTKKILEDFRVLTRILILGERGLDLTRNSDPALLKRIQALVTNRPESAPPFYSKWRALLSNDLSRSYDEDELPACFVTLPIGLIVMFGVAYLCHDLPPHKAIMRLWEHFGILHHGILNHIFPGISRLMYRFFAYLFLGPQQGGAPSPSAPPNASNSSSPNLSHFDHFSPDQHPARRSMAVLGFDAPSPEMVLGFLLNNTKFRKEFKALLSTQTPFLSGCSVAAINAMKALQNIAVPVGDFVCTLYWLGGKLVGTCTALPNPRVVNPSSEITCAAGAGAPPPPGSVEIEITGHYRWFQHNPLPNSVTKPPTSSHALPASKSNSFSRALTESATKQHTASEELPDTDTVSRSEPSESEVFTESASDGTNTITKKTRSLSGSEEETGTGSNSLSISPSQKQIRQVYWLSGLKLYYAKVGPGLTNITQAQMLMEGNRTFLSDPSGLFLDKINKKIYLGDYSGSHTSPGGIYVGSFDPRAPTNVNDLKPLTPGGQFSSVFIDRARQKIYYSGWCIPLAASFLNPTTPLGLNLTDRTQPGGYTNVNFSCNGGAFWWADTLSVDSENGKIYWVKGSKLMVGDINPQNPTTVQNVKSITSYNVGSFSIEYKGADGAGAEVYFTNGTIPPTIYTSSINNRSMPTGLTNISALATDRTGSGFSRNIFVLSEDSLS